MPQYIIGYNGAYNFYSTVSDGPIFERAISLKQLTAYTKENHGKSGLEELKHRLERVNLYGCSARNETLMTCIQGNRAGENEAELSAEEFITKFLTL